MTEGMRRYREPYELKISAKENLDGRWLVAIAITVVAWLMVDAFTSNSGANAMVKYVWENGRIVREAAASSSFNNLMSIVALIIGGPVEFGIAAYFLKLARYEPAEFTDMFSGFSLFKTNFVLNLLIVLFTLLWTLLFIIPGIIAGISYSMAYYIVNDEPEIGAMEAIRKSKEMMYGHKMRFFRFCMSFLGWVLIGIITFGLGMIYVVPYYRAAKANFYLDLKESCSV
ncbi:MAG TPA: DUF975 family protein [Bacillota bacterium]|nr:DUF975 family protein [Bacillota bacterium]HPL52833.1 DUF975 family protein [Bacillota bacterium]